MASERLEDNTWGWQGTEQVSTPITNTIQTTFLEDQNKKNGTNSYEHSSNNNNNYYASKTEQTPFTYFREPKESRNNTMGGYGKAQKGRDQEEPEWPMPSFGSHSTQATSGESCNREQRNTLRDSADSSFNTDSSTSTGYPIIHRSGNIPSPRDRVRSTAATGIPAVGSRNQSDGYRNEDRYSGERESYVPSPRERVRNVAGLSPASSTRGGFGAREQEPIDSSLSFHSHSSDFRSAKDERQNFRPSPTLDDSRTSAAYSGHRASTSSKPASGDRSIQSNNEDMLAKFGFTLDDLPVATTRIPKVDSNRSNNSFGSSQRSSSSGGGNSSIMQERSPTQYQSSQHRKREQPVFTGELERDDALNWQSNEDVKPSTSNVVTPCEYTSKDSYSQSTTLDPKNTFIEEKPVATPVQSQYLPPPPPTTHANYGSTDLREVSGWNNIEDQSPPQMDKKPQQESTPAWMVDKVPAHGRRICCPQCRHEFTV